MMNYKEKTIDSYNKIAKKLSEKFKSLMDLKRRCEFQRFIDLLKTNRNKILDLGCGSGDHSLYFKERGLDVTSIDLSEEMINLCKEKGLNAFLMDIENLEFEDKSFNGIWAVTSLLHVPKSKLNEVIKKLNLILNDNGILYVCVKEGKGEELVVDESGDTRFFAFWSEEEMKKLFDDYFVLLESNKVQLKNTVFLQAFFRKR